jgi:hypothetical protein
MEGGEVEGALSGRAGLDDHGLHEAVEHEFALHGRGHRGDEEAVVAARGDAQGGAHGVAAKAVGEEPLGLAERGALGG